MEPQIRRTWSSTLQGSAHLARRALELVAQPTLPLTQEGTVFHADLTPSRRRNLALQMIDRPALRFGALALPHILHIGVTTYCNLKCPACPTGTGSLDRPAEHLDFDLYTRTLDELSGVLMLTLFWDWGEPFMHPRLAQMIAHASRYGIKSVISTSGTVANSEARLESLVAAQPTLIIVCVDGADQETFEKYRVGGKLSMALDTARRLVALREKLGVKHPVVEFRTLAMRENEHQLAQLLRMAEDCGSDMFAVKSFRPYDYRGHDVEQLVPLSPTLSRYSYRDQAAPKGGERLEFGHPGPLRCAKPHYAPTLNSNGEVAFCSYARHEGENFGSIRDKGFRDLWSGERARSLRSVFQANGGTESCRTCFFRTDHKPPMMHMVPLREFPPDVSLASPQTREEFLAAVGHSRSAAASAR